MTEAKQVLEYMTSMNKLHIEPDYHNNSFSK